MPKVSHNNTIYFLSYAYPSCMKYLFINTQKQSNNMLKNRPLFKKNAIFKGK